MKFFIAFALIATVASAAYIKPTQVDGEIAQIVAAIQSPSTDPATAAALEAMLLEAMGVAVGPAIVDLSPISIGPAIIESNPISVGPAMIDFPLPDGGVVTADESGLVNPSPVVVPSPVIVGEIPTGQSPLVQIIVNVIAQESAVVPSPADNAVVEEVYVPGLVNVVDHVIAPEPIIVPGPVIVPGPIVEPVQVVEPIVPGPVNIVDNVVVEPVQVVEPIIVEPVIIGTPIIPAPVVVLPDELN